MIRSLHLTLAVSCSFFLLGGCQSVTTRTTEPHVAQSWQQQQDFLAPLAYWNIQAKLGIKTDKESHSTLLDWQQQQNQYAIRVTTPIGTSIAQIDNDGETVTLLLSKDEKYQSASLDDLLWNQLGWTLPADHLFYWIRGLPAPGNIESVNVDTQFRLAKLNQSGWSITYTDYLLADGYQLPRKMTLIHADLKLTLLISQWQISDSTIASP